VSDETYTRSKDNWRLIIQRFVGNAPPQLVDRQHSALYLSDLPRVSLSASLLTMWAR
jgi:hypothetical protein